MQAEVQVFEPGARVAWRGTNVPPRVLSHIDDGSWIGVTVEGTEKHLCSAREISPGLDVVAPAPREGQRWANVVCKLMVHATTDRSSGEQELCACFDGSPWTPVVIGDATFLARWLLGRGFECIQAADAAPETLRASEATAATAPSPAAPAPWTLADARRLITETVAAAAPRRPEAFTSALCSLAETETPDAELVMVTAVAFTVLEESLPEHGVVSDWQERRALNAITWKLKDAVGVERAVDALMACHLYLARRGGC
jgi:hypothetical protein